MFSPVVRPSTAVVPRKTGVARLTIGNIALAEIEFITEREGFVKESRVL